MPFFENPFDQEFRGNLLLEDIQYTIAFPVTANKNHSDVSLAWNAGPYNFTTDGSVLSLNYAYDVNLMYYSNLQIDVVGANPAATTAYEVAAALNANQSFADNFVAQVQNLYKGPTYFDPGVVTPVTTPAMTVIIKSTVRSKQSLRLYFDNTGAESALFFNKNVGVAQLPSYFARHTIANRFAYPDSLGMLVQLNPAVPTDAQVITAAGLDPTMVLADWQLLRGRSRGFLFQKNTIAGGQLSYTIEYPAGAMAGDWAKKVEYTYDGSGNLLTKAEIPYVLQAADLITPF